MLVWMNRSYVYLSLFSAFCTSVAHADCGLSLSTSNTSLNWSLGFTSQQINFTVRKSKNPACSYFVTFSKGGVSQYTSRRMTKGSDQLPYQLYKESSLTNILKELPDVTNVNEVISGSFGGGRNQQQMHSYFLSIPFTSATSPSLKPSGNYSNTYIVRVYEGSFGSGSPDLEDSSNSSLTVNIPKITDISLVGSGGGFDSNDTTETLSFGTLFDGASRGFDLKARSNAGFQIKFSSQNNGVLKHSNSSVLTTVPYTLRVNSVVKNLSSSKTSPVIVSSGSGQTGLTGSSSAVSVTIDDVSDKVAGAYSDAITVTATATE